MALWVAVVGGAFAQAPANDGFAAGSTLTGSSAAVTGSTVGATAEAGEPAHAGNTATNSIWWRWTAPQSGRVSIDTFGSGIDTVLAVYSGTALDRLTSIAYNDEAGSTHASALCFYAFAGVTYCIAVDGYDGAAGPVRLNLTSSSSYDLYATDFEAFTVGGDKIIGGDGWSASEVGKGTSGIVSGGPFGGNAAYLGFNPTTATAVSVFRQIGSVSTSSAFFNVDLGIVDSSTTNGKRDAFYFVLYSVSGQLLAAIKFDNTDERIYRYDGTAYYDVGGFSRNTGYNLNLWFDFGTGTWTAALNHLTQFYNQPINQQGRSLSLGSIAATWLVSTPGSPGDNYLLFDNYRIATTSSWPLITSQPANAWVVAGDTVTFTLTAAGLVSASCRWEVSTDGGSSWAEVGAGGITNTQTTSTLTLANPTTTMNGYRYRCVMANKVISDEAKLWVVARAGVSAVAAGGTHTLIVQMNGTLLATGDNSFGQLGDGTTTSQTRPVAVATDVVAVAAGNAHSLFLKTDGTLWGMGDNAYGQLGDGTTATRSTPAQIADHVALVSAGSDHSLFLKTDGTLWAVGRNESGQLGDGTTIDRKVPIQVASEVAGVSGGGSHSIFVKADRSAWTMGLNSSGQLGDGTTVNRHRPVMIASQVESVAAGDAHSLFVGIDGSLWGMGQNLAGQLGDGTTTNRATPVQISTSVVAADGGQNHTLFIRADQGLWGMGSNSDGQLGASSPTVLTPFRIGTQIFGASAGAKHSAYLALTLLSAMGANSHGQLGDGSLAERDAPVNVLSAPLQAPASLAASPVVAQAELGVRVAWAPVVGSTHYEVWRSTSDLGAASRIAGVVGTLFYDRTAVAGTSYSYWVRSVNQLGSSPLRAGNASITAAAYVPTITTAAASQTIDAGANLVLSIAVVSNQVVTYQWRKNGTPIDGATTATLQLKSLEPSDAGSFDVVVTNSAGEVTSAAAVLTVNDVPRFRTPPVSRTVVIGSAATFTASPVGLASPVFEWKHNGQVVIGVVGASLSLPSVDTSDGGIYEITATGAEGSAWTTFRLDVGPQKGAVAAWGNNQWGQTVVPEMPNDVMAVSAGVLHSLALRADGSVVAWGFLVALVPADLRNVVAISAGERHSLALVADGTVRAWGTNSYGQTTLPPLLTNIVAIAAGGYHSLALRGDGTVVAWGDNSVGQCNVPANLRRVVAIAASGSLSQALKSDGTVVAWGPAYNSGADTDTPASLTSVRAISAGRPSLALQSDGTLVAWGQNAAIFEVDSHLTNRLAGVSAMSAGVTYGLAIKTDGTVVAFGLGESGQTNVPAGLPSAVAVAAGAGHSLALVTPSFHGTHLLQGKGYVPGSSVTVSNVLEYFGNASGLSWQVLLPAGWTYLSSSGNTGPTRPGTGATGLAEWKWTTLPRSPITFTYVLSIPADASGDQTIAALGSVSIDGATTQFLVQPDPLVVQRIVSHSADRNRDFALDLFELLRVIELYNTRNGTVRTGCYAVDSTNTEDGFAGDTTRSKTAVVTLAKYHSADADRNGQLNLNELLRVIELYNYRSGTVRTGQYHAQSDTEDGFAAGP